MGRPLALRCIDAGAGQPGGRTPRLGGGHYVRERVAGIVYGNQLSGTGHHRVADDRLHVGLAPMEPVLAAASIGATIGSGISFWLGRRFGPVLGRLWPANPSLTADARALFREPGFAAVAISRFIAPLKAVVPFAAGALEMRPLPFWISTALAAVLSASGTLLLSVVLCFAIYQRADEHSVVVLAIVFVLTIALLASCIASSIRKRRPWRTTGGKGA